jgi:type I restriction-modification system DNA methylase subunit
MQNNITANEPYRHDNPCRNYIGNTLWKIADELHGAMNGRFSGDAFEYLIGQFAAGLPSNCFYRQVFMFAH